MPTLSFHTPDYSLKLLLAFLLITLCPIAFTPILAPASDQRAVELIDFLFTIGNVRPLDKFSTFELDSDTLGSDKTSSFGRKFKSYIYRTPLTHAPHKPCYWTNYLLGMALNVYESGYNMDGRSLYYYTDEIPGVLGRYLILGLTHKGEIYYRAFYVQNGNYVEKNDKYSKGKPRKKGGKKSKNKSRSQAKSDFDRLPSEAKIRSEIEKKILGHFQRLQHPQRTYLREAHIYKVDLTPGQTQERNLLSRMCLDTNRLRSRTQSGHPVEFTLVQEFPNDRDLNSGQEIHFSRTDSIFTGDIADDRADKAGPSNQPSAGTEEVPLMKKIRLDKLKISAILDEMKGDQESTAAGVYGILGILSSKFMRLHELDEDIALEAESHGFIHGCLEGLFRKTYHIDILAEMRAGTGFTDIIALFRTKKQLPDPPTVALEIKRPEDVMPTDPANDAARIQEMAETEERKARKKVADALKQIKRKGYVAEMPNIRTRSKEVILFGVRFSQAKTAGIKGELGTLERVPEHNFVETLIHLVGNLQGDEAPDQLVDGEMKKTIRKAFFFCHNRSYKKSAEYMNRLILGELIGIASMGDESLSKLYCYWKKGNAKNKEQMFFVFDSETHLLKISISEFRGNKYALDTRSKDPLSEANVENEDTRVEGDEDTSDEDSNSASRDGDSDDDATWQDEEDATQQDEENANGANQPDGEENEHLITLPKTLEPHIGDPGTKKTMLSIHLRVHPNQAAFDQYMPAEDIHIVVATKTSYFQLNPANKAEIFKKIDSQKGQKAIDLIKLFTSSKGDKDDTKINTILNSIFENIHPLIKSEKDFHSILEGFLNSQHEYTIFSEATAGDGKMDLYLKPKVQDPPQVLSALGPSLINELKLVKVKKISLTSSKFKLMVDHALEKAIIQAREYGEFIKFATEQQQVKIVAILFVKAMEEDGASCYVRVNERKVRHSSMLPCSPTTGASRSKRSPLCWEDVDESNFEQLKEKVLSLDKESLLEYIQHAPPTDKAKLVGFYKELKHLHVPLSQLHSSPCGNKMPQECLDLYNADLLSDRLGEKLFNEFVSNLESKGETLSPIKSRLLQLEAPTRYASHLAFTIDILDKVDKAIRHGEYKPLVTSLGYVGASYSTLMLGRYMEKKYHEWLVREILLLELERNFKVFQVMTLYTLTKLTARFSIDMIPHVIRIVPAAALNIVDMGLSIKRLTELANVSGSEKLLIQFEESCNIVSDVGQIAIVISGQAEFEPLVILLQLTCSLGGFYAERSMLATSLNRDVGLTFLERHFLFVPFFNNAAELENDRMVKLIYEHELLLNQSLPDHYDAIVSTLPHVAFFAEGQECSNLELNKSSLLVIPKKLDFDGNFGFYLVYPLNAKAFILQSVADNTTSTESPSRTLEKIGAASPGLKIACSPTASDVAKGALPELSCGGAEASFFSISNLEAEKAKSDEDRIRNYCDHTLAIFNSTSSGTKNSTLRVLYNVQARNSSYVQAGNDDNVIHFYNTSYVVGGRHGRNTIVLHSEFSQHRLHLEGNSTNTLVLNCHNFTAHDAWSRTGRRFALIMGTKGCAQEIYATAASYIYTGGNTEAHIHGSPNGLIYVEASARDLVNLTDTESTTFLNLFDSGVGKDRGKAEIWLPRLYNVLDGNTFIRLVENSSGEMRSDEADILDDFERYHFGFEFNTSGKVLNILFADTEALYCRIHCHQSTPIRLDLNPKMWLMLFSSSSGSVRPSYIDIHYKMPMGKSKAYYTQLAQRMINFLPEGTRTYAENANVSLVVHKEPTSLDFVHNTKGRSLIKLSGRNNVVFVQYCARTEIFLDDPGSRSYTIYLLAEGSKVRSIYQFNDDLVVKYECANHRSYPYTKLIFRNFFPVVFSQIRIRVHTEIEIAKVDAFPSITGDKYEDSFDSSSRSSWERSRLFYFHSAEDTLVQMDLRHLRNVFIPDAYYPSELNPLRSHKTLIVYRNSSGNILSFPNFFHCTHICRKNISLILRNGRVTLEQLAVSAKNLTSYSGGHLIALNKLHIEAGSVISMQIDRNFTAFLEGLEKSPTFFIEAKQNNVTVENGSVNGSLIMRQGSLEITLNDWDSVVPKFRPLFVFSLSNNSVLNITQFSSTDLRNISDTINAY